MRFLEYIKSRVKNLRLITKAAGNHHNNLIAISCYLPMIDAINDLEEFDFLHPEIKSLKEITQTYFNSRTPTSTIIIGRDTLNLFEDHLEMVYLKCETVIKAIEQVMSEQRRDLLPVL